MISPKTYLQFDAFTSALESVRTAVLSTHINPDGDGMGSQLALSAFLQDRGIKTTILNHDPIPLPYRFLDPDAAIIRRFDPALDGPVIAQADMIVVVDTNHPDRLGSLSDHVRAHKGTKVVFDHHLEPDGFADLIVADPGACATGEMMYRYLEHMHALPPAPAIATALYTAIMTDTGSFRFPKTDGDVHRIIAALIDSGADPVSVYGNIYERGKVNRLQLLGKVLSSLQIHHDGRTCVLTVTRKMFEQTGTGEIDTDMFVTYGLAIEGVSVAVMVSELPDIVKLNVRSKGEIPANSIAKAFGGNGHLNAAGARIAKTPIDEIIRSVIDIIEHHLPKG